MRKKKKRKREEDNRSGMFQKEYISFLILGLKL